jgi:hypothetical protein
MNSEKESYCDAFAQLVSQDRNPLWPIALNGFA